VGIIGQPWWAGGIYSPGVTPKPVELITGGATRQESVYNGLQALPSDAEQVLIHDGGKVFGNARFT